MCAAMRKLRLNPPSDEGYVEIKRKNKTFSHQNYMNFTHFQLLHSLIHFELRFFFAVGLWMRVEQCYESFSLDN